MHAWTYVTEFKKINDKHNSTLQYKTKAKYISV